MGTRNSGLGNCSKPQCSGERRRSRSLARLGSREQIVASSPIGEAGPVPVGPLFFGRHVWSVIDGEPVGEPIELTRDAPPNLFGHRGIWSISFSPDGQKLAAANTNGDVEVWDLERRDLLAVLKGHSDEVRSARFSTDSKFLVSSGRDGVSIVLNTNTWERIETLKGHAGVGCALFSPLDGSVLTVSSDQVLQVWPFSNTSIHGPIATRDWVVQVGVLEGRNEVLVLESGESNRLCAYDLSTSINRELGASFHGDVLAFVLLSNEECATINGDGGVRIIDVASGEITKSMRIGASIRSGTESGGIARLPSDQEIAVADGLGSVEVWNIRTGIQLTGFARSHSQAVARIAVSSDGRTMATASFDGTVKLWDITSRRLVQTVEGDGSAVISVCFASDGRQVTAGTWAGAVFQWNVDDDRQCNDRRVLTGHTLWVRSIVYSKDGRTLFSASGDRTVKLWDPTSGELRFTLRGHTGGVHDIALSHDSQVVFSGSRDRTVRLWRASASDESFTGN
jgi:WD40 repeat protein